MSRQSYPSDLTNAEWGILEPLLPAPKPGGRPRTVDVREVLNALRYLLREGCRWRAIPHDFGVSWKTVYTYFRQWHLDGTWERVHATLRKRVRQAAGRNWTPSALILDSQSVKTTQKGGRAATTRANVSRDENGTCWSTPSG
jgi:transposase